MPEPLEELVLPPTTGEALAEGETVTWGDHEFTIAAGLPRGWYRAEEGALLKPEGQAPDLPQHPLLPTPLYDGPEGVAYSWVEGDPITDPADLVPLAQLVRFLQRQGLAMVDLDPDHVIRAGDDGVTLRLPPRVAEVGQPPPVLYREGITPPELLDEARRATGLEGVYIVGALTLRALGGDGDHVPPVPGLPQLLAATLVDPEERISPVQLVDALRDLTAPPAPLLVTGAATSVGLNPDRAVNEDAYAVAQVFLEAYGRRVARVIACVADGMGGMAAGEVASRAAAEAFIAARAGDGAVAMAWDANRAVISALGGEDGGCTFTGAVVNGMRFTIAHVGDTRAYLASRHGVTQLTRDHSVVAAMVASGLLTEQEAEHSPERHKLQRAMGSLRQERPGYIEEVSGGLDVGESLILVSDGVWSEMDTAAFTAAVLAGIERDPQTLADALVRGAVEAGGADNATAVVVSRRR